MSDAPARPPTRLSPFFYAGVGIASRKTRDQPWWDFGTWEFDGFDGFPPFLPVLVSEPLHVWDWHMQSTELDWVKRVSVYAYRAIPIRWSPQLLARAFLRWWLWLPLLTGLLYSLSGTHSLVARLAGFWLFGLCAAALGGLWLLNHRDLQIRRLLGRHRLGASDPVTWTDDLRALVAPAQTWFGVATFAQACDALLAQKKPSEAMWAARLSTALEDPQQGRELTDRVLRDPQAQAELARLKGSASPRPVRPWPIVRKAEGPDAQFWYSHLFDGQVEAQQDVQYAGHLGGLWAYSNEPLDTDDEDEFLRNPPHLRTRRSGPHARGFFFGGLGLIAVIVLNTFLFVQVAEWFRLPTLADQMVEQQRPHVQQP
jgi:hypothetical protein